MFLTIEKDEATIAADLPITGFLVRMRVWHLFVSFYIEQIMCVIFCRTDVVDLLIQKSQESLKLNVCQIQFAQQDRERVI